MNIKYHLWFLIIFATSFQGCGQYQFLDRRYYSERELKTIQDNVNFELKIIQSTKDGSKSIIVLIQNNNDFAITFRNPHSTLYLDGELTPYEKLFMECDDRQKEELARKAPSIISSRYLSSVQANDEIIYNLNQNYKLEEIPNGCKLYLEKEFLLVRNKLESNFENHKFVNIRTYFHLNGIK